MLAKTRKLIAEIRDKNFAEFYQQYIMKTQDDMIQSNVSQIDKFSASLEDMIGVEKELDEIMKGI